MLISLVGLPGVGKSTLGRRLAGRLGLAYLDCDTMVEARLGEAIAPFFEREGEAAFRDLETLVLAEALGGDDAVVATGGGAVLREANRRLLRERTVCVYLHAHPEALFSRLRRNTRRPLLRVADPEARLLEMAHERDPLYRECAGVVVEIDGRGSSATIVLIEEALRAIAAVHAADEQASGIRS
ncbi:MAG: shikimate kinase [Caldimonas sp.]